MVLGVARFNQQQKRPGTVARPGIGIRRGMGAECRGRRRSETWRNEPGERRLTLTVEEEDDRRTRSRCCCLVAGAAPVLSGNRTPHAPGHAHLHRSQGSVDHPLASSSIAAIFAESPRYGRWHGVTKAFSPQDEVRVDHFHAQDGQQDGPRLVACCLGWSVRPRHSMNWWNSPHGVKSTTTTTSIASTRASRPTMADEGALASFSGCGGRDAYFFTVRECRRGGSLRGKSVHGG